MGSSSISKGVDASLGLVFAAKDKKQDQRQIDANLNAKKKQVKLQQEQEALKLQQAEIQEKNLLKRAIASQRARFGAGNVSTNTRSSRAVVNRLQTDSNRRLQESRDLGRIRSQQLEDNLSNAEINARLQKRQVDNNFLEETSQLGVGTAFTLKGD